MIGNNFATYVHPDDRVGLLSSIQKALDGEPLEGITGIGMDYEHRLVSKNDDVIWIVSRNQPIRDPQGKIISFAGISHNITER